MNPIRVLDPDVAERVAAGEVIQRPGDVVKELVENAIDAVLVARAEPAGPGQIGTVQVELRGGGLELVRIVDDGCGIAAEQLDLAVARHGTSKIQTLDDLARVSSLGFRGEALPSIAAVAELTVVSRPIASSVGAYVVVEGGTRREGGRRGCPRGTQVTVRRLFQSLPARLAFQRTPAGEAAHIAHLLGLYALAYPELRFQLTVDGRRVLQTQGSGLVDAFAAVFDRAAADGALEVAYDDAGVAVRGLIASPEVTRSTRTDVTLFVNRRPVSNRALTHAVVDAFRGFLPEARFPIAALAIELAPEEIDVNVHPAKADVRFRRDRLVYAALQRAVRAALLAGAPLPTVSRPLAAPFAVATSTSLEAAVPPAPDWLRGVVPALGRPTQAPLGWRGSDPAGAWPLGTPMSDAPESRPSAPAAAGAAGSGDVAGRETGVTASRPGESATVADQAAGLAGLGDLARVGEPGRPAGASPDGAPSAATVRWRDGEPEGGAQSRRDRDVAWRVDRSSEWFDRLAGAPRDGELGGSDDRARDGDGGGSAERPRDGEASRGQGASGGAAVGPASEASLAGEPAGYLGQPRHGEATRAAPGSAEDVLTAGTRLPILRIVGQVQGTYIVCEGPDGVYFVDQHAAHERVLYEEVLRQRFAGGMARQRLLEPRTVDLPLRELATFDEHAADLLGLGFEAERFGPTTLLVRAVPAGVTRIEPGQAIAELLRALADPTPTADGLDRGAALVACHSAVRAGDVLGPDLMRRLIEQLEVTDLSRFCPHGRPTVVRLPATQLERDFGRR